MSQQDRQAEERRRQAQLYRIQRQRALEIRRARTLDAAYQRPQLSRSSPPPLAGLIGVIGIAIFILGLVYLANNSADTSTAAHPGKGKPAAASKLPRVSINGALPCVPSNEMDSKHLTSCAGAKTYAKQLLTQRGQPNKQFQCLDRLWNNESGWSLWARNPSSGAYGIAQSLPGSKMASEGDDWQTNYQTQVRWGLKYITGRYSTPCRALDFWNRTNKRPYPGHWY